jgi:predicted glycoside hydrolase/deacetylase ChbG (UPF0249 family)
MTAAPHFDAGEAEALDELNSGIKRAALGLHVTLTGPFKPVSEGFAPLAHGHFPPLKKMMRAAVARRLNSERLVIEIATQVQAFVMAFGRPPDFIDGHQHVHLFPQVRDAALKVAAQAAPDAWVRQCGRPGSARRLKDRKELLLDVLSVGFRRKARQLGVATNSAFAGAYDFGGKAGYASLFPRFLAGLPDGGLVMCHPGFVDAELKRLDPLTDQREREFAYFNSAEFPKLLAESSVALATPD